MYDWSVNLYISLTLMRILRKEKYELLVAEDRMAAHCIRLFTYTA
jgi:hypothetical protein